MPVAFYDHIHTQLAPGQVRRIAVGKHGHVLAIHHQAIIRHFDIEIADAVDGVVLQQVSSGGFVAQIVDGDHLDLGIVGHGAKTRRPMRPNPLMPTLVVMRISFHKILAKPDGHVSAVRPLAKFTTNSRFPPR